MDLSTILLICAVTIGVASAFAARYRSVGTQFRDLGLGFLIAILMSTLVIVVLALVADLDAFGIIHLVYLLAVVGFPIAVAIVALPHYLDREYRTPIMAHLLVLIALALVGAGLWGTHVEPFRLRVDRQALGVTGVDRPLIVGVLADLQTTSIGVHERNAVDELLASDPDIVVMPGDLYQFPADEFVERAPEFVGLLRQLTTEVDHVILVEGDTDDPEGAESIAEDAGAVFLQDEIIDIVVDGQTMTIVGLTTPIDDSAPTIDPLIVEQLDAGYDDGDLVILVSHRPDVVLDLDEGSSVDLTVSGHTHGGQVSLPGVGPLLTLTDVPRVVAAGGLHAVNGNPIYVSTGVGLERGQAPQLRFGVRPSVGVITIVPS